MFVFSGRRVVRYTVHERVCGVGGSMVETDYLPQDDFLVFKQRINIRFERG
jgi:hypothetical protein